jgi:hypothetical protein
MNIMLKLVAAVTAIAVLLLLSFLLSWPVMFLWNECLVPAVQGLREIGWLQAWGISALVQLLIGIRSDSAKKKD